MNHVLVVGSHITFPDGYASTRFVRLLSQGLTGVGVSVHVLVAGVIASGSQLGKSGTVGGVTYEYAVGPLGRMVEMLPRWYIFFLELLCSVRRARCHIRQARANNVIYYGDSALHLLGLRAVCRLHRIPLISFLVEWPPGDVNQPDWVTENDIETYVPILQGGVLTRINALRFYQHVFRLSDGVIVISRFLQKKCALEAARLKKKLPTMRIPVLVPHRDVTSPETDKRRNYLVFCAHLDGYPQDALFVVKVLGLVDSSTCKLIMVGGGSESTVSLIQEEAERSGVADRVVFQRSYLSDTDLASLYRNAEGLLAPVFGDERSLARFPSKIADYLLSGTPVISGDFGEVGAYLKDGENAFLVSDQSISAFADKISEVLGSRDKATQVGAAGKRLALEEFSSKKQGMRLLHFLDRIASDFWRNRR